MFRSKLVPARTLRVFFGRLRWPKDDLEVLLALDALYDVDEAAQGHLVVVPAVALSWTYLRASWDLGRVAEVVESHRDGRPIRLESLSDLLEREPPEDGPEQDGSNASPAPAGRRAARPRKSRINDGDLGPAAVLAFDALTARVAAEIAAASAKKTLAARTIQHRLRAPWGLLSDGFAALVRVDMNLPDRLSTLDAVSLFLARSSRPLDGGIGASHSTRDAFLLLAGQLEDQGRVQSGRDFARAVLLPLEGGDQDQAASRIGQDYQRLRDRVRDWGWTNLFVPDRSHATRVLFAGDPVRADLQQIASSAHGPPARSVFDSARSPSLSLETESLAAGVVRDWFDSSPFWKLVYVLAGGDMSRFDRHE